MPARALESNAGHRVHVHDGTPQKAAAGQRGASSSPHKLLLVAMALSSVACAGKLAGNESAYRVDRAELGCASDLFQQRCSSQYCHDSNDPTGGLDLASVGYRGRLVGVPASDPKCASRLLIDPVAPEKSFLLEKLSKSAPQCGDQMPLSGEPLSASDLACVQGFIDKLIYGDAGSSSLPDASTGVGGTPATGGATGNGGTSASGGTTSSGGSNATGGATDTGGATATGGDTAAGGTSGSGGSTGTGGTDLDAATGGPG